MMSTAPQRFLNDPEQCLTLKTSVSLIPSVALKIMAATRNNTLPFYFKIYFRFIVFFDFGVEGVKEVRTCVTMVDDKF